MSLINENVKDIHDFISSLSIDSPIKEKENAKKYSTAYRYFHSLLIWREALVRPGQKGINLDALLQYEELLSDLAYAQVLLLAGMYKPSRMMLRSSIENILRTIAIETGLAIAGVKFTYELTTLIRSSPIGSNDSPVRSDLNAIISMYSALCVYTHAASREFLALRVPFKDLTKFDQFEFDSISSDYKVAVQNFNRIIFYLYKACLVGIPHKQIDFALDALPKKLKKALAA